MAKAFPDPGNELRETLGVQDLDRVGGTVPTVSILLPPTALPLYKGRVVRRFPLHAPQIVKHDVGDSFEFPSA